MKRLFLFLMVFVSLFTLSSCKETTPEKSPTVEETLPEESSPVVDDKTPTAEQPTEKTETPEATKTEITADSEGFVFHYVRPDGDYADWSLWIWVKDQEGADYKFNQEVDETGISFKTTWTDFGTSPDGLEIGFLVKTSAWAKDVADDRFISFDNLDYSDDGYYHIYLLSKDPQVYTSTIEVNDMITYFGYEYTPVVNKLRISLKTNSEMGSFVIKAGNVTLINSEELDVETDKNIVEYTATSFKYKLNEMPNLNDEMVAEVVFEESGETDSQTADVSSLYSSPAFEKQFAYDGELGAIYSKENTTFRVWSPVSKSITLRIYRSGTPAYLNPLGNNNYIEYPMVKGEKGTWEYQLNGDYEGFYYTYFVVNNSYPKGREICDPYAKSTGINGNIFKPSTIANNL